MRLCANCGAALQSSRYECSLCSHTPPTIEGHLAFAPELAQQNEGFEADYFPNLFELEGNNFWFRSRNRLLAWALKEYFPDARNFLEIGCGTGYVLAGLRHAFPELSLSGSEIYSTGLSFAALRLPGVELFQMDAQRIPFREEFDVIGAFDVLEHVKDDEDVLAQMYQATRQGGGIILTMPHHQFLWSRADEYARHVRRYTTRESIDKVKRAGFKVARVTSFVSLLLPLMIISRFTQKFRKNYDPTSELRINPRLNAGFEKTLDMERRIIRTGLSFPLGGSLLVVAHRR